MILEFLHLTYQILHKDWRRVEFLHLRYQILQKDWMRVELLHLRYQILHKDWMRVELLHLRYQILHKDWMRVEFLHLRYQILHKDWMRVELLHLRYQILHKDWMRVELLHLRYQILHFVKEMYNMNNHGFKQNYQSSFPFKTITITKYVIKGTFPTCKSFYFEAINNIACSHDYIICIIHVFYVTVSHCSDDRSTHSFFLTYLHV